MIEKVGNYMRDDIEEIKIYVKFLFYEVNIVFGTAFGFWLGNKLWKLFFH